MQPHKMKATFVQHLKKETPANGSSWSTLRRRCQQMLTSHKKVKALGMTIIDSLTILVIQPMTPKHLIICIILRYKANERQWNTGHCCCCYNRCMNSSLQTTSKVASPHPKFFKNHKMIICRFTKHENETRLNNIVFRTEPLIHISTMFSCLSVYTNSFSCLIFILI